MEYCIINYRYILSFEFFRKAGIRYGKETGYGCKNDGFRYTPRKRRIYEGDAQKRDDIIYLEKLPLFHEDGSIVEE